MAEENRFLACVREYRQEKTKYTQDARERFECLRSDYVSSPVREVDSRFECLRSDYVSSPVREVDSRFECLRSDYNLPVVRESNYHQDTMNLQSGPEWKPRTETQGSPQRPPGLPVPRRKIPLSVENEIHFPSLPSSPKTPKTPKLVCEPLKQEIEFIPLPLSDPRYISSSEDGEYEQLYKVVRKMSGGTWSERVKYSQPSTSNETKEEIDYDEDGFPMIRSIESMINNFSDN